MRPSDPRWRRLNSPIQRVVACVVRRGGRFLICQRPAHKRYGGLWEFPGGKAEPNESDEHTAARELREELGVRLVRAASPIFEIADPESRYVIAFLPVDIDGEPARTEHSATIWCGAPELARLPLAPSDQAFLNWWLSAQNQPADA